MRLPRLFFIAFLALLAALPAWGQDLQPRSVEEITRMLQEAGADPAAEQPSDDERVRALRAALKAASDAAAARTRAADFRGLREQAPTLKAQIEAELRTPPAAPTVSAPAGATLAELERSLAQADADAKAAKAEYDSLVAEIPRRDTRLKDIPTEVASLQGEIARMEQAAQAPPPTEVAQELLDARRVRLAAEWDLARARVAELQAEAESYDGRRDLLVLRRDRADRRVNAAQALLAGWQKLVADRRAREAADAARQANERDLATAEQIEALAPVAAQIRQLVGELQGDRAIPRRFADAVTDLSETKELLQRRIRLESDLRKKVAKAGPGPYGPQLQSALRDLKDTPSYQRQLGRYRRQYANTQYRLQSLEDLESKSTDTGKALAEILDALGDQAEVHRDLATRLLEQRRNLVRQVQDTYESYEQTLEELDGVYGDYVAASESLRAFVEQHVFSVRSVQPGEIIPGRAEFAYDARWLLDREVWALSAQRAAGRIIPNVPPPWSTEAVSLWHWLALPSGAVGMLVLGFVVRMRLVIRSRRPLSKTGRLGSMNMAGASYQLVLAVLAAAPVPIALWILSAWLYSTADALSVSDKVATPAPLAVASGLSRAAYVLFGIGVLRELTRSGAVGVAHFRWSEAGMAHLCRHLRWFTPLAVIAAGVIQTFNERTNDSSTEVLGRLTLCVILLVVSAFQFVVFSPNRPFIAEYCKKHRGGMIEKTSWLWYPLVVGLPVVLAIATAAGYVYTALQVQRRVGDSFLFILAVVVGQALVLRSLQLARRKIAIEAAKARMAAAQAEGGGEKPKEAEPAAEVDLQAISIQSRKIIQAVSVVVLVVGLYGVWSEVLPALRWFERLQVLPTVEYLEPYSAAAPEAIPSVVPVEPAAGQGAAPAAQATPTPGLPMNSPETGRASEPAIPISSVTVADIGLAILLLMLTVSASRNVPGLLEITLLPRLPIDAAARYAVFTVVRYVVIIVGIFAISRALEIPWKSAQWLAAALTFGLAFGLQEIFANFVSGLIILFEQPIRVGDTVTVGSVNGTVAKIRMRATTIVDWDNKELVIPNKSFITDQIINWTLSNPVCRVIVPVGIAYGSDTELARELLLKIARESPHALNEPESRALFLGFGDNSLNFELRVFIDNLEHLMVTRSDLHFRIDKAFREAGIEIAFPQRDLHVRSVDVEVIKGLKGESEPSPPAGG